MRILATLLLATVAIWAQSTGQAFYSRNCASCHGADARGGERAGDITVRNLASRDDLTDLIRRGLPLKGMPASSLPDDDEIGRASCRERV